MVASNEQEEVVLTSTEERNDIRHRSVAGEVMSIYPGLEALPVQKSVEIVHREHERNVVRLIHRRNPKSPSRNFMRRAQQGRRARQRDVLVARGKVNDHRVARQPAPQAVRERPFETSRARPHGHRS